MAHLGFCEKYPPEKLAYYLKNTGMIDSLGTGVRSFVSSLNSL